MKFTVVIHAAPSSSQGAWSALKFCQAVLQAEHEIYRLFFIRDGVTNLSNLLVTPQGEFDLQKKWSELISENNLDAVACVTSALKRGILDKQEATRYEKRADSLDEVAAIGGLGQLVDACIHSDRVISFG